MKGSITIRSVLLKDFKSYERAELSLSPFSILIGPNASGKSNAIEALRFIHEIADGRYIDDVYKDLVRRGALRGSRRELVREGEEDFVIEVKVEVGGKGDVYIDKWQVEISTSPECKVKREVLEREGESLPAYSTEIREGGAPHTLGVRYNNFARGGKKPLVWVDDRKVVFAQINTPALFTTTRAQREIPKRIAGLQHALGNIFFLEPRPARMRGYAPLTADIRLESDGSNVSSILYDICERQGSKDKVLEFVRGLPEGEIEDISFIKTERNDVMVQVRERFGKFIHTWDAAVLSDGTLRVLAIASALLSVPPGSLVVIEEIDNGVHPSRSQSLVERISELVRRRSLRVLLTTHNPALLDALPVNLWQGVIYCYRDVEESGASHLIRLVDLPNYSSLVVRGSLGQLLSEGMLEKALGRQAKGVRETTKHFLEWLKEQEWEASGVNK